MDLAGDRWRIRGGKPLQGEVQVAGGKNPALAVIAASLLCDEICVVENVPDIDDVRIMIEILRSVGAKAEMKTRTLTVSSFGLTRPDLPQELSRKVRASSYLMGSLLGKLGEAIVPYPGGCDIGSRGLDQHVKGFRALGADVDENGGAISIKAAKLMGRDVYLDMVTVGGTINIMLAATKANGSTIIYNAAKEPHVVEVANFLNSMGAVVRGAGTDVVRIRGVKRLHSTQYAIIPDQIETGTLMIAAAATLGDVTVTGCIPQHMDALSAKLLECGVRVDDEEDRIRVRSLGAHRAVTVKTQVYPGFPTDLQQPMTSLLTTARGTSQITETIFEQRFRHLPQLRQMGANTQVFGNMVRIEGVPHLYGGTVEATDLRAGACLVIAGLMARGATEILETQHIDRGYEKLPEKLMALGADIQRI
ncbi:MAG: UDP-N-acetylglucosamine 1-carboxyvinyltransferase [Oscillospiraceae bacterium]|jgi:UDP-N-acetylglucosamine 1-carboxyvinyltransferase|nr:UDP-N-acetylglucosamine 1-carboxyvinyltransferase [Oscillospiraceae bacterium]